jgi:hypothetical protein
MSIVLNQNELPDQITHGIPLWRCPACESPSITLNDKKCNNCHEEIIWEE